MGGAPPEAVSAEKAALFERQRQLGWSSLGEAFDQLADAVPERAQLAQTVVESDPPSSAWSLVVMSSSAHGRPKPIRCFAPHSLPRLSRDT